MHAATLDAVEYFPGLHGVQVVAPVPVPVSVIDPALQNMQAARIRDLYGIGMANSMATNQAITANQSAQNTSRGNMISAVGQGLGAWAGTTKGSDWLNSTFGVKW